MKKIIIPIAIGIALIGCKKIDASKGAKKDHVVELSGFEGVDFGLGGTFSFTESNTTSIIVNTTNRVFDAMDIYIEDDILHFDKKIKYSFRNSHEIRIDVSAPNVKTLIVSGSGNLKATMDTSIVTPKSNFNLTVSGSGNITNNGANTNNGALTVSGSGNISAGNITGTNQTMTISGSGAIDANSIQATFCNATISGSGDIRIDGGTVTNSAITISSSGRYRAFGLAAENAEVLISGSGWVELTANSTLDVIISGSGSVYYKGFPVINFSGSGSGELVNAN